MYSTTLVFPVIFLKYSENSMDLEGWLKKLGVKGILKIEILSIPLSLFGGVLRLHINYENC